MSSNAHLLSSSPISATGWKLKLKSRLGGEQLKGWGRGGGGGGGGKGDGGIQRESLKWCISGGQVSHVPISIVCLEGLQPLHVVPHLHTQHTPQQGGGGGVTTHSNGSP